jgi:hypothetical protein
MNSPTKRPTDEEIKRHIDDELDEALEQTFPASDPIPPTQAEEHDIPKH